MLAIFCELDIQKIRKCAWIFPRMFIYMFEWRLQIKFLAILYDLKQITLCSAGPEPIVC